MQVILRTCITFLLVFSLIITCSITQVWASNQPTALTARGVVLMDMVSGEILYAQNQDAKLFPASITKNLTAIIALEQGNLNDRVKTSKLAREQDGNRVYLEYDEVVPMEKLLYGLMLNSGNDAAVAIAEHIDGSVEAFAERMNKKAIELGATHSHFINPNGLHDEFHYTTPYDMALIANYAMKHPKFREIVATQTYEWHGQVWESVLVNINRMLWEYEGATGIKTGYTDQAQQTITVSAKRGDREVLAVVMGVENRPQIRQEATQLLDYGFDHFQTKKIASAGDVITTYQAENQTVQALLTRDLYDTYEQGTTPEITHTINLSPPVAPYFKGSKVGSVTFLANGQPITTADLISKEDVLTPVSPVEDLKTSTLPQFLIFPVGVIFLLLVLYLSQKKRHTPPSF